MKMLGGRGGAKNPSGAAHHLPLQEEALDTACLAKRGKSGSRLIYAACFLSTEAVVYDAATAGIVRTFCGMWTVGTV